MKQVTKQYLINLLNNQISEEENNETFGGIDVCQSSVSEQEKAENIAEMNEALDDLKQTTCSDKGLFYVFTTKKNGENHSGHFYTKGSFTNDTERAQQLDEEQANDIINTSSFYLDKVLCPD